MNHKLVKINRRKKKHSKCVRVTDDGEYLEKVSNICHIVLCHHHRIVKIASFINCWCEFVVICEIK